MAMLNLNRIIPCSLSTQLIKLPLCLYMWFNLVLVYVVDLLITGNDESEIKAMKCALNKAFTIKDLSKMEYFLGIEVARNERGIMLKFIIHTLKSTCKPAKCPFPKGINLSLDEGEVLDGVELCRSIIGKLFYLN